MDQVQKLIDSISADASSIATAIEKSTKDLTEMRVELQGKLDTLREKSASSGDPDVKSIVKSLEDLARIVGEIEDNANTQSKLVKGLVDIKPAAAPSLLGSMFGSGPQSNSMERMQAFSKRYL